MIGDKKVVRAIRELDAAAEQFTDTLSTIYQRRKVLSVIRDLIGSSVEDYLEQVEFAVREDDLSSLYRAVSELQNDARHINSVINRAVGDYRDFKDIRGALREFAQAVSLLLARMEKDVADRAREVIYDETDVRELYQVILVALKEAVRVFRRADLKLDAAIEESRQ